MYGLSILSCAVLGPLLGCCCLRWKQHRNRMRYDGSEVIDID